MDHNDLTNNPNWEKVLTKLNGELVNINVVLTPEEEVLLVELRKIKVASENFNDSAFFNTESKWRELCDQIQPKVSERPTIHLWYRYAAAVIAILFLSTAILLYVQKDKAHSANENSTNLALANNIQPGSNKAILTLANGHKISLTDAKKGQLVRQSGITISKSKDGEVIYTATSNGSKDKTISYNTIETPRGGQYQINLPDGTKVWLNASSSITYPTSFAALNERKIILNGEAYFEVIHDPAKPFKVISRTQELEDIGTHFNINSYVDESSIRTTLLEGAVKITDAQKANSSNKSVLLKPGQMANNYSDKNKIAVTNINIANAVAWKDGYFIFNDENITSIMRDLSRWYDFDVKYQGDMSAVQFHGNYLRSRNLFKLLKAIELTNKVQFKIEGRRITVIAK